MSVNVSFQVKNNKKLPSIPGTRVCTAKSQTLVSSGVVSLDCILGGGIPVGNIVLIEEDVFGFYAQLLMKYFLSEGIVSGHSSLLASLDLNTTKLVADLPGPVILDVPSDQPGTQVGSTSGGSNELKIAWRYHDTPVIQSAPTTAFGHQFDLASKIPSDFISNAEIFHWQPSQDSKDYYNDLLQTLEERLNKGGHKLYDQVKPFRRTVLRIGIHSIGSPLWNSPIHLPQFFYRLRSLVHNSLSVCFITVPSRLIHSTMLALQSASVDAISIVSRCHHLSDCVIRLESLANNDEPSYAEYNGLIYLYKFSTTNTLAPHVPDTIDWAFKLRKRRFIIEKLHLPPELGETVQREQDDTASIGCGNSRMGVALDF